MIPVLYERIMLPCIVRNQNVEKTEAVITEAGRIREIGDRFFLEPIEQAFRIRTGESGNEVLYIYKEIEK